MIKVLKVQIKLSHKATRLKHVLLSIMRVQYNILYTCIYINTHFSNRHFQEKSASLYTEEQTELGMVLVSF